MHLLQQTLACLQAYDLAQCPKDIDNLDDIRLKMCIQTRGEDFVTIHHELGHNIYHRVYKQQYPEYLRYAAPLTFHDDPS